jgi:hypothetical protein
MAVGGVGGGGGGSAGAVRAGRAFVEVSANDDLLTRGLQAAERKLHAWGKTVRNIGLGVSGVGGVVLAPITAAFGEMLAHFSDVQKAAGRLFTTPEIASGLGYALGGLEEMEHAARHLQRAIAENKPAFAELGLSAANLKGLNLEEQFLAIGDALDKIDDPTKKVAVAFELLGRQGASLASRLTGAGLREKIGRAGLIGEVVSSEDAANALKVSKLFSDIGKAIKNTWREVGASILGVTDTFALYAEKLILGIKVVRDWIHDHRGLVLTVAVAAAGVVALGAAIAGLGAFVSLAGTGVGFLAGVLAAVKVALLAAVSPAGLMAAAIGGLSYLFLTQTEAGRAFAENVKGQFWEIVDSAKEAWGAIAHAFQAGRLDLAVDVAMAEVELSFLKATQKLREIWIAFVDAVKVSLATAKGELKSARGFIEAFLGDIGLSYLRLIGEITPEMEEKARKVMAGEAVAKGRAAGREVGAATTEADTEARQKLADADRALAEAKKRRDAAVAAAAAAPIPGKAPKKPPGVPGAGFEVGTSAGAFSASDFRQLLGGNKVEQQQLAVLEEIRDAVKAGTGGFF